VKLRELADRLRAFAAGELSLEALEQWLAPTLAADPLDVALSDSTPWDAAHEEERLFWRLVYLVDHAGADDEGREAALRAIAGRTVACLDRSGSAADTLELLPVLADQDRFCAIVRKHASGVISRTGLLSVVAESGYPPHVKLWLEHASHGALETLCSLLDERAYDVVARMLERAPP
jgi:hypothetical protein